jgi:hypothetical protein
MRGEPGGGSTARGRGKGIVDEVGGGEGVDAGKIECLASGDVSCAVWVELEKKRCGRGGEGDGGSDGERVRLLGKGGFAVPEGIGCAM